MAKKYCFRKQDHIRKSAEFKSVYQLGKSYSNEWLVAYVYDRRDGAASRIGWSISSKTGRANRRFRIKRLIREVFRLNKELFKPGLDIVVIPGKKAVEIKSYGEMKDILFRLLGKKALK